MPVKAIHLLIVFMISITSLVAQGGNLFSTRSGIIQFQSDAPYELIKASSRELSGILDIQKKTFAFKVNMQTFQGFNSALQKEHFNENYLESNKYESATFSGKIIEDIDFTANGTYHVRAKGTLLLHGVSQERIIKSDITVRQGRINISANFTVLLSDHNIPVPKVVKDKLASEIQVDVSAQLTPR
ncbi:YceI family protein [Segetibacter sp. 3557_3]|uniref:YceI family protein n=1 Tax=Segetibacter sp. 3557_3 TaxID=2547429 RepID=UPI001058FBD0|nr:YceI family protein [Segetibacter sp. 3557_3]TDH24005.1 YceI family protein [Segetibacter sp. 3557_3]